jgi:hypothetical protein
MKILKIAILKDAFDEILSGEKTEEYQDRKSESFTKTNKFSLYSILKMLVFGVEVEKTQKPASLSQKLLSIFR